MLPSPKRKRKIKREGNAYTIQTGRRKKGTRNRGRGKKEKGTFNEGGIEGNASTEASTIYNSKKRKNARHVIQVRVIAVAKCKESEGMS